MSDTKHSNHVHGRAPVRRATLLTGTALGLSLLVQAAPAQAVAVSCGAPVDNVVTCPVGLTDNGVSYTAGAEGLPLNIPADAALSSTDRPAVQVDGTTGAVIVNATGVTGNGAGTTDNGGLGLLVTTTSGASVFNVEDVKTTALTYNGMADRTNDALTALTDSGDITITAKTLSTVGTYSSAVTATTGSGDIVLNIDGASSTGVGGVTIGAYAYTRPPPSSVPVTVGGAVTATLNNIVATNGSGAVSLTGLDDVKFTSGSIISTGGANVSEFGQTVHGSGLSARSYAGDVVGTSQTVTATGKRDTAISVRADAGNVTFTSGSATATGDGAWGILAYAGGTTKVTATTTSTQGAALYENGAVFRADAINVSGGTAMIVDSGTASTTGNGASRRGEFPRRFSLTRRCVVWDLGEIEAWPAQRKRAAHAAQP